MTTWRGPKDPVVEEAGYRFPALLLIGAVRAFVRQGPSSAFTYVIQNDL